MSAPFPFVPSLGCSRFVRHFQIFYYLVCGFIDPLIISTNDARECHGQKSMTDTTRRHLCYLHDCTKLSRLAPQEEVRAKKNNDARIPDTVHHLNYTVFFFFFENGAAR